MTRGVDAVVRGRRGPLLASSPGPTQWRLRWWDGDQGVTLTPERGTTRVRVEVTARARSGGRMVDPGR